MSNLADSPVVGEMDVEPVWFVVHGHQVAGFDDAVVLGQVPLAECLGRAPVRYE